MKKLIVAMCVVAFGLATQAASVAWAFSWATDADGNDVTSGTAYLMNVATMTVGAAQTALTARTFDATKAIDSVAITKNDDEGGHGRNTATVDLSGDQTFYVVLVSGDNYGITGTKPVTMKSIGDTSVSFGELSDPDTGASTLPVAWSPGGIAGGGGGGGQGDNPAPEPTSGLLLLVGGALLSLRRKRA